MARATSFVTSLLLWLASVSGAQEATPTESATQANSTTIESSDTTQPGGEAASGDGMLRFKFSDTEWPVVLEWFAEKADLTLDLTDEPPGTFNYVDNKPYTPVEALDVLNGYLLPRGYLLLRRHGFLVVMQTDNPVLPNLIPTVSVGKLDTFGDNELLRIVVPVEGFKPETVANQIVKILGPKGMAAPLDSSDAIVLQGFGQSLREAVALVASAKAPPAEDQLVFRSFQLQHIAASDAERQIQNLFGLGTNPFQASMQRRDEWRQRYSRDGRGGDNDENRQQAASPTPLVQNIAMNMKVSSLRHTNSVLVTATPSAIALVEGILEAIDVPAPGGGVAALNSNVPELRVYTVDNADEDDVAETVDSVIPGVVINEDGRNNSIHVLATPAEHAQVAELIRVINSGGAGNRIEVIRLSQSDPLMMTELLAELFENEDRDDRPVITPGFDGQSLIVRGSSTQFAEVKKALASFGEGGAAEGSASNGSRVRRLPLASSDDAARVARAVRDILDADTQFDNNIRVVFPGDDSTSDVRRSGEAVRRAPLDASENRADWSNKQRVKPIAFEQPVETNADETSQEAPMSNESDSNTDKRSGESSRVTIEVLGNDLLMYSNDGLALDEVEATIRELVRQMPTRREWTVFYLRAAPAESTAQTLVDLLDSGSNGQAVLGIGSDYGYGIGQPVTRIVPDARTNSLFVSGPEAQLTLAENFLKFLDTTELPESLRDRVPRSIPVRYANVNDVAVMIRELYQDFMVDPVAQEQSRQRDDRSEGNDELAQVVATRAKSQGLRPIGIQLTLAVDEVANTLLVSCNDQLFEQISRLVEQRDAAARDSRPVSRVVQLSPGTVSQVREALGGISESIQVQDAPRDSSRDRSRRDRDDRNRR